MSLATPNFAQNTKRAEKWRGRICPLGLARPLSLARSSLPSQTGHLRLAFYDLDNHQTGRADDQTLESSSLYLNLMIKSFPGLMVVRFDQVKIAHA
ncbi:hypothetical protein ElyMa_004197000 [Elysia marginata]|uniref:Uncharacterized protein n=1 Tax=Elysia marginata TaxID=1093978 RepID=A0AAV4GM42_9GAST|nr:hypothetical protein ElyMa_004197000 [Elysia marginata]